MNSSSRKYQTYLHLSGIIYSVFTIGGAAMIGGSDYWGGITVMIIGAFAARLSSELEYRKQRELFKEHAGNKG